MKKIFKELNKRRILKKFSKRKFLTLQEANIVADHIECYSKNVYSYCLNGYWVLMENGNCLWRDKNIDCLKWHSDGYFSYLRKGVHHELDRNNWDKGYQNKIPM